jgi:hypothetical protein
MSQSARDTVIIVHGTWAGPIDNKFQWYQRHGFETPAEGFLAKLDAELEKRGSPARCWSHCSADEDIFHWTGENSWVERTAGASKLAAYVAKLQNSGWRCHIVAHSHGGNVAAEALPEIVSASPRCRLGRIVTLGTPFIDAMTPIATGIARMRKIQSAISWLAWVALAWALTGIIAAKSSASLASLGGQMIIGAVISSLAAFVYLTVARKKQISVRPVTEDGPEEPELLAIGSDMDEAWQVLHHLRNIENPLAIKSSLLEYLCKSAKSQISRLVQIARIHGVKSYRDFGIGGRCFLAFTHLFCGFLMLLIIAALYQGSADDDLEAIFLAIALLLVPVFLILFRSAELNSAFIMPIRGSFLGLYAAGNVVTDLVTYAVRSFGWGVVVRIALGLEGYRYKVPMIERRPIWHPAALIKCSYESMPTSAQEAALKMRQAWVARLLDNVAETFARLALTTEDIDKLLQTIETDQTFVHAAYYCDDACIARIADWIALAPAEIGIGVEVPKRAVAQGNSALRTTAMDIVGSVIGFAVMVVAVGAVALGIFLFLDYYFTPAEFRDFF